MAGFNDTIEQSFWDRMKTWSKKVYTINPFTKMQKGGPSFGIKGILGINVGNLIGTDPLKIMRPGGSQKIDPQRSMAQIKGWVYACIKAIADEISCIEFRVFEIKSDGNHEEQFEHDLLDLLETGNPYQTGPEIRWMTGAHLEAAGNAYWLLDGVKDAKSKPDAIYLLNPAFVKVNLDKTTYPYKLLSYTFEFENQKYNYKPYEIVHLKQPDANNPYEGVGTVQQIAEWIDNDNHAMEFNRQFFINGANMNGVFETEYTTDDQVLTLKNAYESNHQGVENAHKTGVLPKGVHWKATQSSFRDMDFKNLLEMTRDRILAGFRVSKTILGTAESDTNRATAETADYVFAKRTIKPKMQMICSYLNEFLAPRYGNNIYISFQDPTPEDKQFRNEEMKAVIGNQPVLSVNETREKYLGVGPIDGGDTVKIATTMQDVGAPTDPAKTPPAKTAKNLKTRASMNFKAREEMEKKLTEKFKAEIQKIKTIRSKKQNEMSKDEYYYIFKDFESRVAKHEPAVKKAIKKINDEQKKEVLLKISKHFKSGMKAATDWFNLKEWTGITVDALTPILTELYKQEGSIAANAFGKPGIDITTNAGAASALKHSISLLSQSYNETTLSQLQGKLAESLASGEGLASATELVNSIYDFADVTRAEAVAKTETFRIANEAQKQGWKESEVVKTLKWVAFDDDLTCEYCKEMDGKTTGLDDNFLDKGENVGDFTVDYADVGTPPLHTNCRCGIQPAELVD